MLDPTRQSSTDRQRERENTLLVRHKKFVNQIKHRRKVCLMRRQKGGVQNISCNFNQTEAAALFSVATEMDTHTNENRICSCFANFVCTYRKLRKVCKWQTEANWKLQTFELRTRNIHRPRATSRKIETNMSIRCQILLCSTQTNSYVVGGWMELELQVSWAQHMFRNNFICCTIPCCVSLIIIIRQTEMSPRLLHPLLIFLTFISHFNLETFFAKPFFHLSLIMKYFRNFDMTNLEK